jgi:hypothetical protein
MRVTGKQGIRAKVKLSFRGLVIRVDQGPFRFLDEICSNVGSDEEKRLLCKAFLLVCFVSARGWERCTILSCLQGGRESLIGLRASSPARKTFQAKVEPLLTVVDSLWSYGREQAATVDWLGKRFDVKWQIYVQ